MSRSRSEAAIELGKRLVAQLDDDRDIAAIWLSHLLAERLSAVESAPTPDLKATAEHACVKLILELWGHQAEFSQNARPFRDLDAVLRTLEFLDPDRQRYRFPESLFYAAERERVPQGPRRWLEAAKGVDDTARELIRLFLGQAFQEMGGEMQEWVALAKAAAANEPVEVVVVSFLTGDGDDQDDDLVRAEQQRNLDRLESFIALAQTLASQVAASLK